MSEELRPVGKCGKLPAELPAGLKMFSDYLTDPLPAPPASVAVPTVETWNMLGNDQYGDCTFAGMVHAFMSTATEEKEKESFPTAQQTVTAYLAYNQGQDVGAVEATLLQTWKSKSILGHQLAAYAPVNVSNHNEVKQVIHNYGLAYIGISVPESAETQFQQHQPWTITNTPADEQIVGGHCIILVGYDAEYFYAITWGAVQKIDPNWLTKYMDEAWAIITPEIVEKNGLNGLKLEVLEKDINSLS